MKAAIFTIRYRECIRQKKKVRQAAAIKTDACAGRIRSESGGGSSPEIKAIAASVFCQTCRYKGSVDLILTTGAMWLQGEGLCTECD